MRKNGYNSKEKWKLALEQRNPDEYQILCWDCNIGKQKNGGICPHIEIKDKKLKDEYGKKYREKLKKSFFELYGGKCRMCGMDNRWFLSLDHINNNGAEARRTNGENGNQKEYRKAVEEYNPEEYQILCFNCNCRRKMKRDTQSIGTASTMHFVEELGKPLYVKEIR